MPAVGNVAGEPSRTARLADVHFVVVVSRQTPSGATVAGWWRTAYVPVCRPFSPEPSTPGCPGDAHAPRAPGPTLPMRTPADSTDLASAFCALARPGSDGALDL
jgi:hypothetical protein